LGLAIGILGAALFPGMTHASCAAAAGLTAPDTQVTAITETASADHPFCKITGTIQPIAGSHIGFELWLPAGAWNGKFEMVGNGGYSSSIDTRAMAALLAKGYAVAATDTGHQGDDPSFAEGHPEAIDDWAWRAVHVTATTAKAIATAFYGRAPAHSYFSGCSTGGQQALMEAQRFPADFDGIIAGDPGNDRTRLNLGFLWMFEKTHMPDGRPILTADTLRLVNEAVLKACAGKDGGAPGDRFLTNPFACTFDPQSLRCAGADAPGCLSDAQVAAVAAVYAGARNPRTGAPLYYGWIRGSEAGEGYVKALPGWSLYWADPQHPAQPARLSFWRDWVFHEAGWSAERFDFDHDADRLATELAPRIDAVNPDLSAFQAAGGKLIQYHGLADPVVPPMQSLAYARAVTARTPHAARFYRLYLVPGMLHCGGGEGPAVVDVQTALEAWVEQARAPQDLLGTKYADGRPVLQRPICAWPKQAVYRGGDATQAASFACRLPSRD
jgi:feruloyl esterase